MYCPLESASIMALIAESTNQWHMAEYFWKLHGKSKWWILKWKFRTRKLRKIKTVKEDTL